MAAATADMQSALNIFFSPSSAAVKIGRSGEEARHITVDIISVARVSRDVLTSTWCFRRCVACRLVSSGRRKILKCFWASRSFAVHFSYEGSRLGGRGLPWAAHVWLSTLCKMHHLSIGFSGIEFKVLF